MESDSSTPESHSSPRSSVNSPPPLLEVFSLSAEDVDALKEYLDEFQEADADRRNTIIANAMADIVTIRPAGETFNKLDASTVRLML